MNKYNLKKRIFIYMLPLISVVAIFIIKSLYVKYIVSLHMPCFFHLATGYWCPGCGGTRSMLAFFQGHIIKSLQYNPIVVIAVIILILVYIQLFLKAHGSKKRVLPKDDKYIVILVIIMLIYYLLRNFIPFLHINLK